MRLLEGSPGPSGWRDDPAIKRRLFLIGIPVTLAANTAIAAFLVILLRVPFLQTLLHSQLVGCSILFLNFLGHYLTHRRRIQHWWVSPAALILGAVVGVSLAGPALLRSGVRLLDELLVTGAVVVVFGTAMTYYFHSRGALAGERARAQAERLKHEQAARQLAEAELKLLQAQIEPHFLFNTLSNVLQLVDADPAAAKRMLHNLTGYLRASLRRTRAGPVTLGEELDLVRAYLEIQAVRMGRRLSWRIDCPDELRGLSFPPLLVQPLVENAVRHGLDPQPKGGEVAVAAAVRDGKLVLEVKDDGKGLDPHQPAGIGLANVRERVQAISGGRGTLTLHPLETGGLCARIVLPPEPATPAAPAPGGQP
ncbi:MAG TPA: histidine kinase [Anaeromyxobacter sp.]|nr:histidine kinase [Anaeromyxobacter sp.]